MEEQSGGNYVTRVLELFAGYGDTEAIVWSGRRVSYAELVRCTLALAAALGGRGLHPGATVAILVPDQPETAALQLALHLLGCRTAWIASYAPRREQAAFIKLADPDAFVYHPAMIGGPGLIDELTHGEKPLRLFSFGAPMPGNPAAGDDLLTALERGWAGLPVSPQGPEPESLFYSGGTTGTPKLIRHHQAFYQNLLDIADYYLSIGELPMRFLSGSSFSHVSGQLAGFLTLFEGGTLFQSDDFSPAGFLAIVEHERISSAFLTPALLYAVADHPSTADTSSLRYLNVGGAAASPTRLAAAIERFGPVLRLVYGSSEAPLITDFPFLDHDPDRPERLMSCGRPFLDMRIEIRDERGREQPVGEAGEVWVAGSLVMAGYWAPGQPGPDATGDGWIHTGDVGYLDEDGYLYLVDRTSDMIVTSEAAANVYCRPIEDALHSHPGVRAAAVAGVPDEACGEVVCAFVVTDPGAQVSADDLRQHVRAQLNALYTPRRIEFVGELPLTGLAKVDKRALRLAHLAGLAHSPAGSGAG
ncbi:MAG TPA: AMP-binding protein [Streptosporangiaceae bacterium]|jgi:acyl-CoA synthetase (AMP-forming)/AMP-acid ligase II